jgi:two-component system, chemotaxis family, protein-glutamate methylesterase/glutaminase
MSARGLSAQPPRFRLVVVIASLGGLPPISALLAGLPANFPVPLLVLQHRHASERHDALAWLLASRTALPVRSAHQARSAYSPGVTVIPPGAVAAVDAGGYLRLRPQTERMVPKRTDGDALLASAAASADGKVIGVVLSGKLGDGTAGVRAVKRHGGRVLAQDPATAQAPSMPASAIATGCVDFILPPERIPAALISLAMAPGGAQLLNVPLPHWAQLGA